MSKVLMAIRPEYVERILNGQKQFEFRKRKCKREVDSILVYCTAPIKRVVGEVEILDALEDTPKGIWNRTKQAAGISKDDFFKYFTNTSNAVAYRLGEVSVFKVGKELSEYGVKQAPQSYIYL